MVAAFTADELRRIIRATVGVDDSVNIDGDVLDTPFAELGYDSLAVLEITNKIDKEVGVAIPEDDVPDMQTPRELIEYVNGRMAVNK